MTWDPTREVRTDWQGGPVTPCDVLYEVDGPTIFTAQVGLSKLLFFKHDETEDADIFVAAAVSDADSPRYAKGMCPSVVRLAIVTLGW